MKKIAILLSGFAITLLLACGGNNDNSNQKVTVKGTTENKPYDTAKGVGFWNEENLKLSKTIDTALAHKGELLHQKECASCHTITTETLVGPGWKGITQRRKPEWIMNYINNPDAMIDKDPKLRAALEKCYVRMPDPHLTDEEARSILEFIRLNDIKN